jgi:hypothetical protein
MHKMEGVRREQLFGLSGGGAVHKLCPRYAMERSNFLLEHQGVLLCPGLLCRGYSKLALSTCSWLL